MEILKEKVTFYDKLIQLQIYDINKSFLNSALSKTYFQISNSIIFILEYNSSSCLENFLSLFEKLKEEGMSKKISLIIWKENSIFKGDLNFLLDDKSKKRDSSENHSIISTLNLINNPNSTISNMTELVSTTLDTNTSKQKSKFDSNKNSLLNLQIKLKSLCKVHKLICIYISTISEISTDNEIFRNFIGYLLLKKFNTPDTSKFRIKNVKKRSSYTLSSSEKKMEIKNKKKKTSNKNKNNDDIRIERMINSHRKTSQF